ncbi:ADP-ribosylglycohydrolase family protein [Leptolyngbya sp. 7M]|uniref:ADP-ribosylglycohydrolase family protein n=1 Tax=Leptolyngbya sp. 7M TaxID=2812896 RepID=UPI001B8D7D1B|nr:ADP-ribosylglycohydrolase family protein [Leptolyngbya sp. 7M]QYO64308.1 ADP-ribosylglycohydrolase family protein [Leptolyngbya sp. 7M]
MRDSLLSRFRAAFWGAWLGETIGAQRWKQPVLQPIWGEAFTQAETNQPPTTSNQDRKLTGTGLLIAQTKRLLAEPHLPAELDLAWLDAQPRTPIEWVMATLPLALLYHDQPAVLQTTLQTALRITPETASQQLEAPLDGTAEPLNQAAIAMAITGQTISLLLRERFVPQELILQVMQDLELPSDAALSQQLGQALMQVQAWLDRPTSLATVSDWIRSVAAESNLRDVLPIVLALYSILSTPDSWRLSLARLVQLSYPTPSAKVGSCTLAGALSGLYNGLSGLPLVERGELLATGNSVAKADLLQLADHLLARWSGGRFCRESRVVLTGRPPANKTADSTPRSEGQLAYC